MGFSPGGHHAGQGAAGGQIVAVRVPGGRAVGLAEDVQLVERAGELGTGDVVVDDPDCVEEGLVHQPSNVRLGPQVEIVQVEASQPERQGKSGLEGIVIDAQAGNDGFGIGTLSLDAGLLLGVELA